MMCSYSRFDLSGGSSFGYDDVQGLFLLTERWSAPIVVVCPCRTTLEVFIDLDRFKHDQVVLVYCLKHDQVF